MKKIERWLFWAFIFSVPIQARIILWQWKMPFNEWTSAFLWGTDLLLIFVFVFWIARDGLKSIKKPDILLILILTVSALSVANSIIPEVSWYRVAKLFEYMLLFFYVKDLDISRDILKVVVASAIFQSIVGIGQFAIQSDFGIRLLGESVLDPLGTGVAVLISGTDRILRAYGTTPHPNLLAVWLVVGLWSLWALYRAERKNILLLIGVFILFGLFFTFSRTAIAIWLAGSIVLWFWHRRNSLPIVYTTIIVGIIFLIIWRPYVYARLRISTDDDAVQQRLFYGRIADNAIKEHRWIGLGIGQFGPKLMDEFPLYPDFLYQPAHMMFQLIAAEIGIIGFVIFIIFLLAVFIKSWRAPPVFAVIFTSIILLSLFDHYFWTLQQGGLIWWGLLGVCFRGKILLDD